MMLVALLMLLAIWLLLTRTRIGLVIQAALTHPEMVEALGHNVPRVFMLVFGGGCALAGAGRRDRRQRLRHRAVRWRRSVGSIIFVVVVVGGMGSLAGAFVASLLIGLLQTFAVAVDYSLADAARRAGRARSTPDDLRLPAAEADDGAGRADPAVPAAGADPDLPAQGPDGHAGRLMP